MADAGELKDILIALEAAMASLPAHLDAPQEIAGSLQRAVEHFVDELESRQKEAAPSLERAQQVLEELGHSADTLVASAGEVLRALEGLLDEHTQAVNSREEALSARFDAAQQAEQALQQQLVEASQAAQTATDAVGQSFGELRTTIEDGKAELQTAVDALDDETDALVQEISEERQTLEQKLADLGNWMTTAADQAESDVQAAISELQKLAGDNITAIDEAASTVSTGRDSLLGEIQSKIEDDLNANLTQEISDSAEALKSLGQEASAAAQRCEAARPSLEAALASVKEPGEGLLPSAVEQVKQAANIVGLLWGG